MTCAQGLLRLLWGGGARSWSATGLYVVEMVVNFLYVSDGPINAKLLSIPFTLCSMYSSSKSVRFAIGCTGFNFFDSLYQKLWIWYSIYFCLMFSNRNNLEQCKIKRLLSHD